MQLLSAYLVDAVGKRESVEVLPCWHEVVTKHRCNVISVVVWLPEVSIEGPLAELHGNRSHHYVHQEVSAGCRMCLICR